MSFFIWSHIFEEWNNHALFIWSHILSPNVHHVVLLTGKVQSLETSSNVSCECTDKGLVKDMVFYWKSGFWIRVSIEIDFIFLKWTDCKQDLVKLTACNWTRGPSLYYIFCCLFDMFCTSLISFCMLLMIGWLNLITHTLLSHNQ